MRLQGHAFKYGDNVDTDVIIPARYLNTAEPAELARHCLEDLDPSFIGKVCPGDILVAGSNFGCGSSREHAPVAIKASGISCVVARSFARIFYRNAINMGLPILESAEARAAVAAGDQLEIDLDTGRIADLTRNLVFQARPFPAFIQKIIAADGLMGTLRNKEKQE